MKILSSACLLGAVIPVILGCQEEPSDEAQSNRVAAVVPVQVSTIRQGDIGLTIDVVGHTEALRRETVLSPVAGTVGAFKAFEGTAVQAGELLVVIQTRESQAALAGAEVLLDAARTPEQRNEAERAVELAKSNASLVSIVSRSSGIVSSRRVVEGSLVAEGSELLSIVDPASVEFVAQIPVSELASVKPGQSAKVTLMPVGRMEVQAMVSAISPESDPQTQTVRARLHFVTVPSEERVYLKDGVSGMARIVTGTRTGVLLLPSRALLRNDENNTYTIVTVTHDSLARTVPVVVGVITDSIAEVSGPVLQPGMSVVVAGHYALADSTRVTVTTSKAP